MPDSPESQGPGDPGGRPRRARGSPRDAVRGRLKAHDPFELIRWLAMSQPDPRKALAELIQNSLDAGARRIRVIRLRERGLPCLRIQDDGEGVIPEMARSEALRYIATHIGHSLKRSLSPKERLDLMTQGQYGIGLLGFWSLGATLEIRTSIPGDRAHRLVLHRDRPDFLIEPLRGRLPLDERFTEVLVAGLHREAMGALVARRAAEYLAAELRGQLLAREVDLVIEDRMSRGRAQKIVSVRPPRFLGDRIEGLSEVAVPGHPPVRLEIYLSGEPEDGGGPRGIAVYSTGTLVAAGFHDLAALALDHSPWTDHRLSGLVDFPGFSVAPGSRRGVLPDEAAGAFAAALIPLEPVLTGVLESLERRRAEELDRTLIRDLQRAFRDFHRQRPRYAMLPVQAERDQSGGGADSLAVGGTIPIEPEAASMPRTPPADLLPAGPLARVRLTPSPLRLECRGTRRARAEPVDSEGRVVEDPVEFSWHLSGAVGTLAVLEGGAGRAVILTAGDDPAEGRLTVTARSGDREASAEVVVEVLAEIPSRGAVEGIPEPELVDHPGAAWRSRMIEGRWQVNVGHAEYRAIADRAGLKLRYLAMLFAKEIVLLSSRDPRLEKPLEQLVEVAAYADRSLALRRDKRRDGGSEQE